MNLTFKEVVKKCLIWKISFGLVFFRCVRTSRIVSIFNISPLFIQVFRIILFLSLFPEYIVCPAHEVYPSYNAVLLDMDELVSFCYLQLALSPRKINLSFDANVSSFSLVESPPRDLQITGYK